VLNHEVTDVLEKSFTSTFSVKHTKESAWAA
jgi:hypothetical protein